jgi:hypothetical protein
MWTTFLCIRSVPSQIVVTNSSTLLVPKCLDYATKYCEKAQCARLGTPLVEKKKKIFSPSISLLCMEMTKMTSGSRKYEILRCTAEKRTSKEGK